VVVIAGIFGILCLFDFYLDCRMAIARCNGLRILTASTFGKENKGRVAQFVNITSRNISKHHINLFQETTFNAHLILFSRFFDTPSVRLTPSLFFSLHLSGATNG